MIFMIGNLKRDIVRIIAKGDWTNLPAPTLRRTLDSVGSKIVWHPFGIKDI